MVSIDYPHLLFRFEVSESSGGIWRRHRVANTKKSRLDGEMMMMMFMIIIMIIIIIVINRSSVTETNTLMVILNVPETLPSGDEWPKTQKMSIILKDKEARAERNRRLCY